MARPKNRATTSAAPKATNAFLSALQFVSVVTHDKGAPYETHVHLHNGWVTAFNGVIAAGTKITEEIYACPNNKLMIEALSKCGEHISITQLDNNRLSIKSDKFKAIVPCVDPTTLQVAIPDPPIAEVNDKFKVAIEAVGVLVSENARPIELASVLMQSGSVVATTGKILFEYWHGIDMPTMAVPKPFVNALVKCSKKLVKFGFSRSSITFYFEDESWLRTQLYSEQWPDVKGILDQKSNAWPLPADFYKALDAVAPFSPDGLIYFEKNLMRSHIDEGAGATYEVAGLPAGFIFSAKQLYLIQQHVQTIDFFAKSPNGINITVFFGNNIRGAISGRTK